MPLLLTEYIRVCFLVDVIAPRPKCGRFDGILVLQRYWYRVQTTAMRTQSPAGKHTCPTSELKMSFASIQTDPEVQATVGIPSSVKEGARVEAHTETHNKITTPCARKRIQQQYSTRGHSIRGKGVAIQRWRWAWEPHKTTRCYRWVT